MEWSFTFFSTTGSPASHKTGNYNNIDKELTLFSIAWPLGGEGVPRPGHLIIATVHPNPIFGFCV